MTQSFSRLAPLPPLPFGERLATISANPKSYGDHVAAAAPSLQAFEPLDDKTEFRTKSSAIEINGLKLASGANTPVTVEFATAKSRNLIIPFFGTSISTVGRRSFNWDAGQNAMYLPPIERVARGSKRSYLHIDVDPVRLQRSARAMLGLGADELVDLYLDDTRLLPLNNPGREADKSWRQICGMIDSMCETPELLGHMGVDELIYRNMVLMFRPDLFGKSLTLVQQKDMRVASQRALDPLCSYIQAKVDERITLTDMERISGMSSRALQYAFLQRFACTPMNWVMKQRLGKARLRLLNSQPSDNITVIALEHGFASASAFSAQYMREFGEKPSTTRSRQ
ncbi:MAG: AraC family transcriptional regulator [Rhodoferax sp.]